MKCTGEIRVAAAVIQRADGQVLLVRKRGTQAFMQPGGKIEAQETASAALCRELHEELGLVVPEMALAYLGQFSAPAANEPGFTVVAEVFRLALDAVIEPAAEIEEAAWVAPDQPGPLLLAPLTRDCILPRCI